MTNDADLVWKALADPRRRAMLDLLAKGPLTTGEVVAKFDGSRTGIMKHLELLREANLVLVRREGRVRWNHINSVPIQRVCGRWVSGHVKHMASAMNRLKRLVETKE